MGFLDFLFGRKSDDLLHDDVSDVPTGPLPWRERVELAQSEDDFDWSWGNAGAHRIVHGILEEAAPRFGTAERPARIKEIPDDEHIDLRGTWDGTPIRFAVWMSFGSFWTIEMRVPGLAVTLDVERDLDKIPKTRDADDPFDDDEGVRVFVARGVFFEGDEDDVTEKLALWNQIPESKQEVILQGMEGLDVNGLYCVDTALRLNQRPGLPELDDPVAYMVQCAEYLAAVRDTMAELSPASAAREPAPTHSVRIRCSYCSTQFLQTPAHQNCPNCGAAPGT